MSRIQTFIDVLHQTHKAKWEATPNVQDSITWLNNLLEFLFPNNRLNKTDIHPAARIGVPFMIDHSTGIVIGATSVIGNNVSIYQGVTLGALQVAKELAETKRHPTVEDNVIVYARTTILGGKTVIGRNSIIGGSVFLTKSIDPYSQVFNTHQIRIECKQPIPA